MQVTVAHIKANHRKETKTRQEIKLLQNERDAAVRGTATANMNFPVVPAITEDRVRLWEERLERMFVQALQSRAESRASTPQPVVHRRESVAHQRLPVTHSLVQIPQLAPRQSQQPPSRAETPGSESYDLGTLFQDTPQPVASQSSQPCWLLAQSTPIPLPPTSIRQTLPLSPQIIILPSQSQPMAQPQPALLFQPILSQQALPLAPQPAVQPASGSPAATCAADPAAHPGSAACGSSANAIFSSANPRSCHYGATGPAHLRSHAPRLRPEILRLRSLTGRRKVLRLCSTTLRRCLEIH